MEFWRGKTAVVTGAGAGIGLRVALELARAGMTVVGLERCADGLRALADASTPATPTTPAAGRVVPLRCDVSSGGDVRAAFASVERAHGGVDVLVNNAALCRDGFLCTGDIDDFKQVIDTNIFGVVACTRLAVGSMQRRGARGHIINLNSICGHYVPPYSAPTLNVYVVSKHALTALTEVLRQELRHLKLNVKVTSVSPGVVSTGIFEASNCSIIDERFLTDNPHLQPEDVAAAVLHALAAPPHVQHHEILLHALHEVY